ncbi:hypothetical protein LTR12_001274 [Friedmanniomyces endolithicus]|nr:hypothetical protein LTR12_001274 [Friedmanniomyces endolithicus]
MANTTLQTEALADKYAHLKRTIPLTALAPELLVSILTHTTFADLKRLQSVNRACHALATHHLQFLSACFVERERDRLAAEVKVMTFDSNDDLLTCLLRFDKHCGMYSGYKAAVSSCRGGGAKVRPFAQRFLSAVHARNSVPTSTTMNPTAAASWASSTGINFEGESALDHTIYTLFKIQLEVDNNEYADLSDSKRRSRDLFAAILLHNVSKKRLSKTAAYDLVHKFRTELPFGQTATTGTRVTVSRNDPALGKACVACHLERQSETTVNLGPCSHDPAIVKYGIAMLESLPSLPGGFQYLVKEKVARRTSAQRAVEGIDAPLGEPLKAAVLGGTYAWTWPP